MLGRSRHSFGTDYKIACVLEGRIPLSKVNEFDVESLADEAKWWHDAFFPFFDVYRDKICRMNMWNVYWNLYYPLTV